MKPWCTFLWMTVLAISVSACDELEKTEEAEKPDAISTPALDSLPNTISTLVIPVRVPLALMGTVLEKEIPSTVSGSVSIYDEWYSSCTLRWQVSRTDFQLQGGSDTRSFKISTNIHGNGEVSCLPDPSFNGSVTLTLRPTMHTNWTLRPNLTSSLSLSRATAGPFSVRSLVGPPLTEALNKATSKLDRRLGNDDFLLAALRGMWKDLCRNISIGPSAWLKVLPKSVIIAQPKFGDNAIQLDFGINTLLQIVTAEAPNHCPFPSELTIADKNLIGSSEQGQLKLLFDTRLDYHWLSNRLEDMGKVAAEKALKEPNKSSSVKLEKVHVYPHGEKLLLQTTFEGRIERWFRDTVVDLTLYLWAKPRINRSTQTLHLEDLEIDLNSRSKIIEVLGELAEPVILGIIANQKSINLDHHTDRIKQDAERALQRISPEDLNIDANIDSVELTDLQVGPEHLRLVAVANGGISVEVQAVSMK